MYHSFFARFGRSFHPRQSGVGPSFDVKVGRFFGRPWARVAFLAEGEFGEVAFYFLGLVYRHIFLVCDTTVRMAGSCHVCELAVMAD